VKYREKEYSESDIANIFVDCCDEVFKHIYLNKVDFQIKFRMKKDEILLDFVEYSGTFKFDFKINHLIEDTIREVTANIKRKRDKLSTNISLRGINFNSTVINDSDYFSPVVKSDVNFEYKTSYRDFASEDIKQKMVLFVKHLSKNKKKKVLKHCLSWNMKKTSPNAKGFYNMLTEQLNFKFQMVSDYFKVYSATDDDIKKILGENITNNDMLEKLKKAFKSSNYRKKYGYNYNDSEDISIIIDTIEHVEMVKKSNQHKKDLLTKKKEELNKLLVK
jgi:hypothetical protein